MRSAIVSVALAGTVASLLFVGLGFRGEPSGIVRTVHAQEDEENRSCSVASLRGAYGFFRTGTVPAGPVAAVGLITFDGNGSSTVRQTIRRNGVTTQDLFTGPTVVAPYEIDADCAGRGFNPDGSVFVHFVVVDGGNELFILSLADSNTTYGVMKKIHKKD